MLDYYEKAKEELDTKEFSGRVLMPGKAVKIEDLSDEQLKNVAKYGETPRQRKNIRNNSIKATTALGISSGITGYLSDLRKQGIKSRYALAGKFALAGTAAGAGMSGLGHLHHKRNAKLAKEEIKRREEKKFSKAGDRDRVPEEIIKKVKAGEGVIHKYKGSWRIVSMKTNPPTFWDAHYETRERAEAGLRAWAANNH
jgi:hypothetical protein